MIDDYRNKFEYVLLGLKNDLDASNHNNYSQLLENEDIVSALFMDIAKDMYEYSNVYDVDIKLIDDIKILYFLSINFYKIIEKDVKFTKKYIIFESMISRFVKQLPSQNNYNNKILFKLNYMFNHINSYDDILLYNGKFGIFQILKSIYNLEQDCYTQGKSFFATNTTTQNNFSYDDELLEKMKELENSNGEISLADWIMSDGKQV